MSINIKRLTGKSKRRWKALRTQGNWIPYIAIRDCNLQGDWDNDIMRMGAREKRGDISYNPEHLKKMIQDMTFCGTGIMQDGKHIPIDKFYDTPVDD